MILPTSKQLDVNVLDEWLKSDSVKPDSIIIHPSRIRISKDKSRFYVIFFIDDVVCYKDGKYYGQATNLDDAISWVDDGKEIEMWT